MEVQGEGSTGDEERQREVDVSQCHLREGPQSAEQDRADMCDMTTYLCQHMFAHPLARIIAGSGEDPHYSQPTHTEQGEEQSVVTVEPHVVDGGTEGWRAADLHLCWVRWPVVSDLCSTSGS